MQFAATKGYFQKPGQWVSDPTMHSHAVGKVVTINGTQALLEFAAGNTVALGMGLLFEPQQWEIDSWHRMRNETKR